MPKETVTSNDVARLANVSQSAVSRTFTAGASVSRKTGKKVLAAAKTHGYRPNAIARSLISGRSMMVGQVLGQNGKLYNTLKGEKLPAGISPMPVLSEDELLNFPEPSVAEVVPNFVARHMDMMAMARHRPASVIGVHAMLRDKPGFTV